MNAEIEERILSLWTTDAETVRIIHKMKLSSEQFKTLFASRIFNYLLGVYNKKTVLGDCPVVFAMLSMFKKSNLSIAEVHHVCDTFKLTLTQILIKNSEQELLFHLLPILRENFKGVLKSYMDIQYDIDIGVLQIVNSGEYLLEGEKCSIEVSTEIDEPLQSSHNYSEESDYVKNYVNTSETEEEVAIIESIMTGEILDDFTDTNEMFLNTATLQETYTPQYHELLSSSIDMYISIFLDLVFFNKIADSLNELKYLIKDTSDYTDEQLLILKELSEALMLNLIKWKEEVLDNHSTAIHYYDDAIMGDVAQLKVMLSSSESPVESAEDLNDIFDF